MKKTQEKVSFSGLNGENSPVRFSPGSVLNNKRTIIMSSHASALGSFAKKLSALLMLRGIVAWTTVWFFIWGVVVLAVRFSGLLTGSWLALGLLGCLPLALIVCVREWRRRESLSKIRAAYDGLNQFGGVIMAEEVADTSGWQAQLSAPAMPVLRWKSGRALGLLAMSAAFAGVILALPDRLTVIHAPHSLEIGKLVGELTAEIQTLKDEKILEDKKADETQKKLADLQEKSSGLDPAKTWEALDHIKETDADLAKRAAEEAVNKMANLAAAQTLASAMTSAEGMSQDTADHAASDLASMLKSAKLEEGLLKGTVPQELLDQLNGLNKEQLDKLLGAIQFNKNGLNKSMAHLAKLKLIDPKTLPQCTSNGQCTNCNALAAFLSTCTNAGSCNIASLCYGRGGPGGGGGTGPMTWQDKSSEDNLKFKENALPPAAHLSDAQFVGVSQSAPQLSADDITAGHGALASAQASGGSANSQVILPQHRQAIQRFFQRDAQ